MKVDHSVCVCVFVWVWVYVCVCVRTCLWLSIFVRAKGKNLTVTKGCEITGSLLANKASGACPTSGNILYIYFYLSKMIPEIAE